MLLQLVGALVEAAEKPDAPTAISATTVGLIVELLCFCVTAHSYRIKWVLYCTFVGCACQGPEVSHGRRGAGRCCGGADGAGGG